LIAIRIAVEAGYDVALKAEVTDPHKDGPPLVSVWISHFKIHKQTGEAELQMTL